MTGEKPEFLEITEILEGKTERSKNWLKGAEDKVSKKVMRINSLKIQPNGNMELGGVRK